MSIQYKKISAHLFGTGAVNAKMEGRWSKTPAMNSSPILDNPCREDPSAAMNTFLPFPHKLMCTCDPEPTSSNAYLSKQEEIVICGENS